MNGARAIFHLALADFRERIRSDGFLVVLGVTVFGAYMFVPAYGSPYATLVLGNHRAYYDSAWVGTLYGVVASALLGCVGFYLVKSAVTRDYETGVGQIIATTPTSKPIYMLGKWISNVAVLTVILAVLTVMAPLMQVLRAEDSDVSLWAVAAPIWLMGLPTLAVVAALAVLFESVRLLRGGVGNVAYFFLWAPGILGSEGPLLIARNPAVPRNDILGLSRSIVSIREALTASGADWSHGVSGLIAPLSPSGVTRFEWPGMDWTWAITAERLGWTGVAVAIALLASLFFDRFDPARGKLRDPARSSGLGALVRRMAESRGTAAAGRVPAPVGPSSAAADLLAPAPPLTRLEDAPPSSRRAALFAAELRLMLMGQRWLWYAGAVGLAVATLTVPLPAAHRYLLPAVWLWPVVVWSAMGSRERLHDTQQIVFSVAHVVRRQMLGLWAAGFVVAVVAGGGVLVRLLLAAQWTPSLAWLAGAAFIPSLALALGTWSGGTRLFEVAYVVWWYLGPINRVAPLDFAGVTSGPGSVGTSLAYLAGSAVLLGTAWLGRRRQIQA